ncbi:MAG TPA: oligosaccharide flippase family protein [Gemmatimonadales bacterium]
MKVIALTAGPAGMGLFSVLRQMSVTGGLLAVLNGQPALIQGIASRAGQERARYVRQSARVVVVTTVLVALALLISAPWMARWILGDPVYASAIRWLSLSVTAAAGYTFLTAVLNGHRALGRLALTQVASVTALAALAYPAVVLATRGWTAAYSWLLVLSSTIGCAVAVRMLRTFRRSAYSAPVMAASSLAGDVALASGTVMAPGPSGRSFVRVAGPLLLAGIAGQGVQLVVRALVVQRFDLHGAGLFDVAWTLSMTYVMLILTSLQGYYLPVLSQARDERERSQIVRRVFRLVTIALVPVITAVVVLKPLIIRVLYSGEFVAAGTIMEWMLLGDYLKVSAWVLAMPMLSTADMRPFLWAELAWSLLLVVASYLLASATGVPESIGMAFTMSYLLYLVLVVNLVRVRYDIRVAASSWSWWAGGLLVIVAATLHAGHAPELDWWTASLWVGASAGFSVAVLRRDERRRVMAMVADGWRRLRPREAA